MKMKRIMVGFAGLSCLAGVAARGEFVPGHIFVSQLRDDFCQHGGPPDRIWEIDPDTGEVSVFLDLPECVHLTGLTFTPDGSRLRGAALVPSQILEFDSEGNITVALDSGDGIAGPEGDCVTYDTDGNFYVANGSATVMRFPTDGGPGSVIAGFNDGVRSGASIGFTADGDLYLTSGGDGPIIDNQDRILRFVPPDWEVSIFDDDFPLTCCDPATATGDDTGHLYIGQTSFDILRYDAGNTESREILVPGPDGAVTMAMAPDQTHLYALHFDFFGPDGYDLLSVDTFDGTIITVADVSDDFFVAIGMAVVPVFSIPGDFDFDGDVDLEDVAEFQGCFSGVGNSPLDFGCGPGDFDHDVDIDLSDFALLQLAFTGP